ncbi:MAG: AEC family transporter, partial [Planctomycetota bacterium]
LATLSADGVARLRFASMLIVLAGGLGSGYLAANRFGVQEHLAKKLMTVVLVCLNWPIALLVIWRMQLTTQLVWLPIVGVVLMLTMTTFSAAVFSFLRLGQKARLTLILAGALSNLGYTGGAFVCYALFGAEGLGLANLYLVLWIPTVYLVFFPILKAREIQINRSEGGLKLRQMLDARCLAIPAVISAIALNLTEVRFPVLVSKLHIIDIFVYTASSLAFFAIGLRIKVSRLKNYVYLYFPLAGVKFIATPAVALVLVGLLGLAGRDLSGLVREVIVVLSVTPSAVVMVTISNVFDLDGPLASALWVVTTGIFAVIVVPVLFFVFG